MNLTKTFYTKLFFYGAIWNFLIASSLGIGYKYIFPFLGMKTPTIPLYLILALFYVFVLGLGYLWVSQNLDKNHGIVQMGIVAKLGTVIVIIWGCFFTRDLSPFFLITGIGDFIFTIFFIRFLGEYNKIKPT